MRLLILSEIPFWFSGKGRKLTSFCGAICCCFGEKVLLIEQKIFLCYIKSQKQRCFRSLTKRWPWLINSQPFELERKFRIKRKRSTIFLPWFQGKKTWSRQASLHAPQVRFMHRRCASWHNVPLHTAKPCFIKAWRWSIVSVFISLRRDKPLKLHNMKHLPSSFHYAAASHFIPIWSTSLTLRMM